MTIRPLIISLKKADFVFDEMVPLPEVQEQPRWIQAANSNLHAKAWKGSSFASLPSSSPLSIKHQSGRRLSSTGRRQRRRKTLSNSIVVVQGVLQDLKAVGSSLSVSVDEAGAISQQILFQDMEEIMRGANMFGMGCEDLHSEAMRSGDITNDKIENYRSSIERIRGTIPDPSKWGKSELTLQCLLHLLRVPC